MKRIIAGALFLLGYGMLHAQKPNYDESKMPPYTLPDPLKMENGQAVTSTKMWNEKRRPEILQLFETHVYGKAPAHPEDLHFKVLNEDKYAVGNMATRKEVAVYFTKDEKQFMTILMYIPNKRKGAVPMFFGLNFKGNHSVSEDPGITQSVIRIKPGPDGVEGRTGVFKRGAEASRWPIEMLIANGYAVATVYRGDIDPDYDDGYKNGVQPLFYKEGQTRPAADEWGTLAAWAWGLSCAMDYFKTDADIDSEKIAVVGHSRHGKTALWTAAIDPRFAMAISNDSGCGGAALTKRIYGETVSIVNNLFPHWFCDNFKKYNDKEELLPVDQHQLIALMAPRPVYIASAVDDKWADPKGEFLSGVHAEPVYKLFGLDGLNTSEMPPVDQPIRAGVVGYHVRTGDHDINLYDWQQFVKFADQFFK
jgi:hypothetical protein